LLIAVLVLSFLPSESVDPVRMLSRNTMDLSHVPAYASLAGTVLLSVPKLRLWHGIGIVFAITLLGLAIELTPASGRTNDQRCRPF